MRIAPTIVCAAVVTGAIVGACTAPEHTFIPDQQFEARGGAAAVPPGSCVPGVDCSGCTSCFELCLCSSGTIDACAASCGLGPGGAAGQGGMGGAAGVPVGGMGGVPVGGMGGVGGGGQSGMGGVGGGGAGGTSGSSGASGSSGTSGSSGVGGSAGMAGTAGMGGFTPTYRIELRVHRGESALTNTDLGNVFGEMNDIWFDQAGICFEIHTVTDDVPMTTGIDLWFVPQGHAQLEGFNAIFRGIHDTYASDAPSLSAVSNPVMYPTTRPAASMMGFAMQLTVNSDTENLMANGTLGWQLTTAQATAARTEAQTLALADTAPLTCGPPQIN